MSSGTSIRLALALGTSPDLWLNLQIAGNLWNAQQRLAQRAQGKRHAFHRRHSVRVHAARVVRGDILASDVANAAKDLERHQTTLEKCERLTAATQR